MDPAPDSRRLTGCLAAVLLTIVGVGGGVYYFAGAMDTYKQALEPRSFPSEHTYTLTPGIYTLYYEHEEDAPAIPPLSLRLLAETGAEIGIEKLPYPEAYRVGTRHGSAFATFRIDQAGEYRLLGTAEDPSGSTPATIRIAVGKDLLATLLRGIFIGMGFLWACVMVAALVAFLAFRSRRPKTATA